MIRDVHISCAELGLELDILLGQDPPAVTGGVGGWTEVDRPKNKAMTRWEGVAPFALDLPLMVDGFMDDEPVQSTVTALLALGSPGAGTEPPKLSVDGPIPVLEQVSVWIVDDIDWGDPDYNDSGDLVRQPLTLRLKEHVPVDVLGITPGGLAAGLGKGKGRAGKKEVRVRKGDTLKKIATRTGATVKDLKERNGIRDPNKKLKVGRTIVVP